MAVAGLNAGRATIRYSQVFTGPPPGQPLQTRRAVAQPSRRGSARCLQRAPALGRTPRTAPGSVAPRRPTGCVHRQCGSSRGWCEHAPRRRRPRTSRHGPARRGDRRRDRRTSSSRSRRALGRRRAMPCRHRGVVGAGASSRSCLCGRAGSGAVGAQERRSARRAGPPLRQCGRVERRIAFEHLAAASALAGTHVLRLLLGGNHSHDVHRRLPSRPQTHSGTAAIVQ